jgi:hypothetical protein
MENEEGGNAHQRKLLFGWHELAWRQDCNCGSCREEFAWEAWAFGLGNCPDGTDGEIQWVDHPDLEDQNG